MIWEMAFPSLAQWRTTCCSVPRSGSPLGEITVAGTIKHTARTHKATLRVYGQWALVYLLAGQGFYYDAELGETKVSPGQWILVFPEVAHSYGPSAGERWDEVYVSFQGPIFDLWRRKGLFDRRRPVGRWLPPSEGGARLAGFFALLRKKTTSSVEALCQWQILLAEMLQAAPPSTHPAWFEQALDLLEHTEPSSKPGLQAVARSCGLSYESFRKKFEVLQGTSPGHYALERKMEQARRLLLRQNFTNKELAEMLGFYDEFHFSKTFSRVTGQTPRQFRQSLRQPQPR